MMAFRASSPGLWFAAKQGVGLSDVFRYRAIDLFRRRRLKPQLLKAPPRLRFQICLEAHGGLPVLERRIKMQFPGPEFQCVTTGARIVFVKPSFQVLSQA